MLRDTGKKLIRRLVAYGPGNTPLTLAYDHISRQTDGMKKGKRMRMIRCPT